jgi:signal transduction histidine kinase
MASPVSTRGGENELMSRISHELRTPLTSIIGYAEVMLSDPRLSPDVKREYVEIIRDAGKRLSNFLDNYFDEAFTDREEKVLDQPLAEDLSLVIKWSVDLVAADAESKGVSIASRCDRMETPSYINLTHLVHILQNILTNSIEASPREGRVLINVVRDQSYVEICVITADVGILSASVSEVCQSFKWTQSPGVEIRDNGLGLAFAKHVVELEGGDLTVQTENQQGLMFKLRFPVRSGSSRRND